MKRLFRKILVPHDLSEHATRALALAADLAARHRGRLTVLHVITPFQPILGFPDGVPWSVPQADITANARRALEDLVARTVRGPRAPAVDCRVVLGEPVQRILNAARGADVIVMATLGRTGLSHLLIGSVAERMVRHAPVPVLTLRPAARRKTVRTRAGAVARMRRTRRTASRP